MEDNSRKTSFRRVKRVCSLNHSMKIAEDRISSLPEDICSHIISFLQPKDAVATSILSRRWRYIWAFAQNLEFDYSLFPRMKQKKEAFINFVDRSLVLREGSNVQKLRLSFWPDECHVNSISTWISSALRCKVKELYLDIACGVRQLPSSLFTSESVMVLKLNSSYFVPRLPSTMNFSRLTTLHLEKVGFFKNSEVTPELFCSCPVLEDLNIDGCLLIDFEVLNISCQTLKRLTIGNCVGLRDCKIKVSSPNLIWFKYMGQMVKDYSLENLSSLVEADINLRESYHSRKEGNGCRVSKILRGLCSAKVMTFSFLCMELLSPWEDSLTCLPTFFSLRHLKLNTGPNKDHIELISCFLMNSPNLETLIIDVVEFLSPERVYFECLPKFYDLKYLKMNIGLRRDHIQLLTCLLENSPNLETLIVNILEPYNISEDSRSGKLIFEFPIDHVKTVEIQHFGVSLKNVVVRHRGQAPQDSS